MGRLIVMWVVSILLFACGDSENPAGGEAAGGAGGSATHKEFVAPGMSDSASRAMEEAAERARKDVAGAGTLAEREITEDEFGKWMAVNVELLESVGVIALDPAKLVDFQAAKVRLQEKHGLSNTAWSIIEGRMMAVQSIARMAGMGMKVPEDLKADYALFERHRAEIDAYEAKKRELVRGR